MVWQSLGASMAPSDLTEARQAAHHAAQMAAAPGLVELGFYDGELDGDFPHETGALVYADGRLLGEDVSGDGAQLELRALDLLVDGERFALPGKTEAEALDWLARKLHVELDGFSTPYDLGFEPPARFAWQAGLPELDKWFTAAEQVLAPLANARRPLRCWPHHFDLAVLFDLGEGRSLGVGFSPGDGGIDEPYFYVTPWPYPEAPPSVELPGGDWVHDGWVGAVLRGMEVVQANPSGRKEAVVAFLQAGVDAFADQLRAPSPWPE